MIARAVPGRVDCRPRLRRGSVAPVAVVVGVWSPVAEADVAEVVVSTVPPLTGAGATSSVGQTAAGAVGLESVSCRSTAEQLGGVC